MSPGAPAAHVVVGPGALGRVLAHALARTGPVTLLARRFFPARQTLTTPEGESVARRLAFIRAEQLARHKAPAFLHLMTKTFAAERAAEGLMGLVAPGTPLILWQNGFAVQPRLTARWPGPVLCASTTEGAYVIDDASTVHAGRGESVIGDLHGRHAGLARTLAATLENAGLPATAVDDITTRLWHKLAVNAAINPLAALYEVPNGALADPRFRAERVGIIEEIAPILAADGIVPPCGEGADGWQQRVARVINATAGNRASMLQDIDAGRPTEREAILGPLIERAKHHRLPCPMLGELNARLAAKEARGRC